jgi:hypothetical protein
MVISNDLKQQADQKIKVADHLLSTTYSLVKEPKLLVSVMENMHSALELAITAHLEHDKRMKGLYQETFESKFEIFRRKIATRLGINKDILDFIIDIKGTMEEHKRSSVEFVKKERLVISDNDYNLRTLDAEDVKKKLAKTKKICEELFAKLEN